MRADIEVPLSLRVLREAREPALPVDRLQQSRDRMQQCGVVNLPELGLGDAALAGPAPDRDQPD
jgi:hypothetical protein